MKITLTLAALALSLTPALASPCSGAKDDTAASCLPGYSWDSATASCIATPSS